MTQLYNLRKCGREVLKIKFNNIENNKSWFFPDFFFFFFCCSDQVIIKKKKKYISISSRRTQTKLEMNKRFLKILGIIDILQYVYLKNKRIEEFCF